jgi:molybdopterin molybdotransferase
MLSFSQARARVIQEVSAAKQLPPLETVALELALGRVLAAPLLADRDSPALDRSVRDGYAVRASDTPGELRIAGEVRAGESRSASSATGLQPGEAIEIMTGAPVPAGADAVVMVEHTEKRGDHVYIPKSAPGQFISFKGEEARAGQELLPAGKLIAYSDVALLASNGQPRVAVYQKPRVAILPTGDELVAISDIPRDHQIRNSNTYSLSAQILRAGGKPYILPPARDNEDDTRGAIERALPSDLLLLSGGVSAGKYDIVERVLADLGAEFFFDRVAIQPGQPVVFGRVQGKFFFGLPGNPGSTMVTFEIFARAALELLAGRSESCLPFALGRLTRDFQHKPGLTRFLPASLSGYGDLTPMPWKGSSDVPAISRANAFLVATPDQTEWRSGDTMSVLLK